MHPYDLFIAAPNSAIDSYYELTCLELGKVNKASRTFHTAGGKGFNTGRALRNLGGRALCTGIVGGSAGQFIASELDREGIVHDLVWSLEESRRCNTIHIEGTEDTTVILENGLRVGGEMIQAFTLRVLAHSGDAPYTALVGSLPSGFPQSFYGDIIRQLKRAGTKVCIDSSGRPLQLAVEAGPWMIKVNLQEFQSVFLADHSTISWQAIQQTYEMFYEKGLEILAITDGKNGAFVFTPNGDVFHAVTHVEKVVSSAGSGDTFLAALLLMLGRGEPLEKAVSFASAAAAANLLELGCGFFKFEKVNDLIAVTKIERNPWR